MLQTNNNSTFTITGVDHCKGRLVQKIHRENEISHDLMELQVVPDLCTLHLYEKEKVGGYMTYYSFPFYSCLLC
jgi:hypothetical protein